jgi:Holliday junction resolvase
MSVKAEDIKKLGIEHERNLVNLLQGKGFMAGRLQQSGVSLPDVIAGDSELFFVFEVKSTKSTNIKIYKRQIWSLRNFAYNFNAKPYVAVYFIDRMLNFLFIELRDLNEYDKMFTIDYNTACLKGRDLNEIISNEIQRKLI